MLLSLLRIVLIIHYRYASYQSAYALRIGIIGVMRKVQVEAPRTAQNDVKSKTSFFMLSR